jgi:7-keto-8-aminopelargonate synthetase-like enzyme
VDIQTQESVQLFDKCRSFTKAREIQAAGLYPYFKPISDSEDTTVVIEGQKRIMLGSNNYLGLTHHPKVLEAASRALSRYGSGCTSISMPSSRRRSRHSSGRKTASSSPPATRPIWG